MQHYRVRAGATSQILRLEVWDSTNSCGARLAGLTAASSGLTCYYSRVGASGTATAMTLSASTKGTWTSSGFVAVDGTNMPGLYELGVPNAALATGASAVEIRLAGATAMVPVFMHVELDSTTVGSGAITWTYTVTRSDTGAAIPNCDVWVSTDVSGSNIIASGVTNSSGIVTFYLDAGTVYVWRACPGYDFTNPDTEVVV